MERPMKRHLVHFAIALGVVALLAAVPTPAMAQSDDNMSFWDSEAPSPDACPTGTYFRNCAEWGGGVYWNFAECPNKYIRYYYGPCKEYRWLVSGSYQYRHDWCPSQQKYVCSTSSNPIPPYPNCNPVYC
jgi:hypothetical protein